MYPDPASATTTDPFVDTDPGEVPPPPGVVELPPGIVEMMTVEVGQEGLKNVPMGHSYIVLTERLERPDPGEGWIVEPARLTTQFQLDQRGTRWVRLVEIHRTDLTDWGPVQDCEFQVVKT